MPPSEIRSMVVVIAVMLEYKWEQMEVVDADAESDR